MPLSNRVADFSEISLWTSQLDEDWTPRPPLGADVAVDVAIIGAGYTGLWTAYYLKIRAPQLRIAVLEAEVAGFGASARNGGWVIGGLLGEDRLVGRMPEPRRRESWELLHRIPQEVLRATQEAGIDCDFRQAGTIHAAARYPEQEQRLRARLAALRHEGLSEEDYRWLPPAELASKLKLHGALGALYTPHTATIQPAKLARGLGRAVEALGVTIYEKSAVIDWEPGLLRTAQAKIAVDWIVPAVESFAASLPPLGRYQLPVHSLIVATESLPDSLWETIGLAAGEAFSDASRQVTYGQRSRDNRLVFGARGGYRFGGRMREDFTLTEAEIALRRGLFTHFFPQLKDVRITHSWGGNLGMSRRFHPHMLADTASRIAVAGGYGGEGVGASNLAGRTLADLILGNDSLETAQPWVIRDRPIKGSLRGWEPEPLRWLGYNAIMRSFAYEERVLADGRSPPWHRHLATAFASGMGRLMS